MGIKDKTIFLLFPFSEINLLMEVDSDRVDRVMNRLKVGKISIYNPIPL